MRFQGFVVCYFYIHVLYCVSIAFIKLYFYPVQPFVLNHSIKCFVAINSHDLIEHSINFTTTDTGLNNSGYLLFEAPVSGWNISDCKWTFCPHSSCVANRKKKKKKAGSLCEVFPVCRGQYLSEVVQRRTTAEPVTRSRAVTAQCRTWRVKVD